MSPQLSSLHIRHPKSKHQFPLQLQNTSGPGKNFIFPNLRGKIKLHLAAGHQLPENSLKCSPAVGFISLNAFINAL